MKLFTNVQYASAWLHAYIEMVFHFLPNSNNDFQGLSYQSLQIIHWCWKRRNVDQAFYVTQEKKVTRRYMWRSKGPIQEHAIIIFGAFNPSVVESSVQILSYNETLRRWCPCWQPYTKCPADCIRPSLFQTKQSRN